MDQKSDRIYILIDKAVNLIVESSAKIDFLTWKLQEHMRNLDDEEMARVTQRSILQEEDLDVSVLDNDGGLQVHKDRAINIQRSLQACREQCNDLFRRLRDLIDMKDTLFCQTMIKRPQDIIELLPGGSRMDTMILELKMESIECSICTENVRKQQQIWSCKKCFNIFHLECATKCMEATKREGKWACPYCRDSLDATTEGLRYICFCGRTQQPRRAFNVTPHGCGQSCVRGCGKICHPGPCSSVTDVAPENPQTIK